MRLQQLLASQGLRHSLIMVVGTALSMVISAGAVLIYSRLLGPVAFGEFTVGFSLFAMLSRLNDMGLTLAMQKLVPKQDSTEDKAAVISYANRAKLIVNIAFTVIGVLLTPLLAQFLRFENVGIIYIVFLFNWVTTGFEQVVGVLQALRRVSQSVIASNVQAVAKLVGALGIWAAGMSSSLIALLLFISAPLASIVSMRWLKPEWLHFSLVNTLKDGQRALWLMAGHTAVYYVTLGVIDNVDVLLVQRYLTDLQTGYYSGASRIGLIFILSSYALAAALNPRVARYTAAADLRAYVRKALLFSAGLLIAGLMVLPFAKWVILLTVGSAYLPALTATQLLIYTGFVALATAPLMALFFSFSEGNWYFSLVGIVQLAIILVGNMLFTPEYGLDGAGWVRLLGRVVVLVITLVMGWHYSRRALKVSGSLSSSK